MSSLTAVLARTHRPEGRRLGIAVVPGVGEDAVQAAADAIEAHGSRPERRLARIQPAPGRDRVSAQEAVYFLQRFGHEYTVVLWPAGVDDVASVQAAASAEGVTLIEV